jgi:hypothetical protein
MKKRSASRSARASMAIGLLLIVAGCPGSLANPERFFVDAGLEAGPIELPPEAGPDDAASDVSETCPSDIVTGLFAPRCATAPCHSSIAQIGGLDLQTPDVGQRLRGAPSATNPALRVIDVADPEKSVLYLKVGPTPPFGNRMPIGGVLSEVEQACVLAWIKSVVASGPPPDAATDAPAD